MSDNPFDEIDPPSGASRIDKLLGKVRSLEASGDSAVSKKLARGRYQITPDTAEKYKIDYNRLDNPDYAQRSARRILTDLAGKYPDDSDVLVAYNAGPGRVGKPIDKLPGETQDYLAHNARLDGKNPFDVLDPPSGAKPTQRSAYDPAKFAPRQGAPPRSQAQPIRHSLVGDYMGEVRQAQAEAMKQAEAGQQMDPKAGFGQNTLKALGGLGGAFDYVLAPVSAVGRTLQQGIDRAVTGGMGFEDEDKRKAFAGDVATAALPVGGEEKLAAGAVKGVGERAAKIAAEKARMAPPMSEAVRHGNDVAYLKDKGVRLTEGQIKGGAAKTAEEKATSGAYKGPAIAEMHKRAYDDFNKAAYNQALSHIGEKFDGQLVGREGVAEVGDKISAAYDRVLPKGMARSDPAFETELEHVVSTNDPFTGQHRGALQAAVDRFITPKFGPDGVMTGEAAKDAETDLNKLIKNFAGKGGSDGQFAEGLMDIKEALMSNVERNSPPGVRPEIKKANAAYRDYKMIENASTASSANGGRFTPSQLVTGAKRGSQKGQFAKGRAGEMQKLGDSAQRVIGDKYPDSGTAGREAFGRRGLTGAGIGAIAGHAALPGVPYAAEGGAAAGAIAARAAQPAINALARHSLEKAARRASTAPKNYLKAIDSRVSPMVQHRPAVTPARINALRLIANPQQTAGNQ